MILSITLGSTQCSPLGCGLNDSASSCTRLNPQRRCRLHAIVREFDLAEVELWSIMCRVRWREAWRVQLTFLVALALLVQSDSDTQGDI
jgi:hypothetical protein